MDLRTVASKVVGQMANSAVPFPGPGTNRDGHPGSARLPRQEAGQAGCGRQAQGIGRDFAYIAYFHYIMQLVRAAETRAPTRLTSLDMVWFRFFNPKQTEHPDYPPLPPMVILENAGELVNDLMRLAMMGMLR